MKHYIHNAKTHEVILSFAIGADPAEVNEQLLNLVDPADETRFYIFNGRTITAAMKVFDGYVQMIRRDNFLPFVEEAVHQARKFNGLN